MAMIDFHQHIGSRGRTLEHLLAHQEAHGVKQAVVLPIDRSLSEEGGHMPTEAALEAARTYPDRMIAFCHVDPRHPDALDQIRRFHAAGARGYGEHKLRLPCDLPEAKAVYRLCGELSLPVLLHFEYLNYNHNFAGFEQVLRDHPETTFIGHAQAWWANVSAAVPQPGDAGFTNYPKGPVVRGGLTDRWLSEYPHLYADLSAGSGLGALTRDPEFAREFVNRHRKKLLWATDCPCRDGRGDWGEQGQRECFAARSLPVLRELCADQETFDDATGGNARRLLGLN
ncbi:MAG: amidohydrolase family protein [Chloroflexi bacterium]|nr:amidohydrolase family protein [Chloroflexota bacterium]